MFRFLTPSLSLYAISDEKLDDFKAVVNEYPYISLLVMHEDRLDLFSWRLAMDIYFNLEDQEKQLIYLLERGMVSPLTYFLMQHLVINASYQNLKRKQAMEEKERLIYAVFLANTLSKWAFDILKESSNNQHLLTGDIAGILRSFPINMDELPTEVIQMQSSVMTIIKEQMLLEDTLTPKINEAIIEAYSLYYAVSS